jgi:hypothetical protein
MSDLSPRNSHNTLFWLALALFALTASTGLVTMLESRYAAIDQSTPFRLQTYAAADETWTGKDPRISRTLKNDHDTFSAAYSFISFDNDPIQVQSAVQGEAYRAYRKAFGYRQQELDALFDQQRAQLEQAEAWAVANLASQQQLDQVAKKISDNYDLAVKNLLTSRGFRFLDDNLLAANIPEIVKNNVALFQPIALSLQETMRKLGYSEADTIGSALPLVQTAIAYEALPKENDGRITAGFSPPLEVFMEGRGDCDAKSALLASILLNWDKVKLIGVGVPGHYLLGILQHPAKGDAFIEYEGLNYVLMEPSGPAWVPPGYISDYTLKWLDSQDQTILERIALN